MRFLLDAHISSRRIGRRLRAQGHDVVALDREQLLAALPDESVMPLATREGRVLVTHNVKDFAPILRLLGEGGQSHAGCILVTLPHNAYGDILRGLAELVRRWPEQDDWIDRAHFLS